MSYESDTAGNMVPTPEAARLAAKATELLMARRSAAACSRIVGYRLQDGTDKAELYFLPGRPAQKTLNQMADLIAHGWMVTGIIYSENSLLGSWETTKTENHHENRCSNGAI